MMDGCDGRMCWMDVLDGRGGWLWCFDFVEKSPVVIPDNSRFTS